MTTADSTLAPLIFCLPALCLTEGRNLRQMQHKYGRISCLHGCIPLFPFLSLFGWPTRSITHITTLRTFPLWETSASLVPVLLSTLPHTHAHLAEHCPSQLWLPAPGWVMGCEVRHWTLERGKLDVLFRLITHTRKRKCCTYRCRLPSPLRVLRSHVHTQELGYWEKSG